MASGTGVRTASWWCWWCLAACVGAAGADPIHDACAAGNVAQVEALVRADPANLSLADVVYGGTPLHWAVSGGQGAVVMLLIRLGAPLDERNLAGLTPLHGAAMKDQVALVQLLLTAGADPTARSSRGATPLDLATGQQCATMLRNAEEALFGALQAERAPTDAVWLEQVAPDVARAEGEAVRRIAPVLGQRRFQHGLLAQAKSSIEWVLPEGATRVVVAVGIHREGVSNPRGSVNFELAVDGEVVARSTVIRPDDPPQVLSANLRGKKKLALRAGDARDGTDGDAAGYGGGLLYLGQRDANSLPPPEPAELRLEGTRQPLARWRVLVVVRPQTSAHLALADKRRCDVDARLTDGDIERIREVVRRWPATVLRWSGGRVALETETVVSDRPVDDWKAAEDLDGAWPNERTCFAPVTAELKALEQYDLVAHVFCAGARQVNVPSRVAAVPGERSVAIRTLVGERWRDSHVQLLTRELIRCAETLFARSEGCRFDSIATQAAQIFGLGVETWAPRNLGGLPQQHDGWELWGHTASVWSQGSYLAKAAVPAPQLKAPLWGTVWDQAPLLQWRPVPGDGYRVTVWPAGGTKPAWTATTKEVSAQTPAASLRMGERYVWQATALRGNRESPVGDLGWFACGPLSPPRINLVTLPPGARSGPRAVTVTAVLGTRNAIRSAWVDFKPPKQPVQHAVMAPITPLLHEARWSTRLLILETPAADDLEVPVTINAVDCAGRAATEWSGKLKLLDLEQEAHGGGLLAEYGPAGRWQVMHTSVDRQPQGRWPQPPYGLPARWQVVWTGFLLGPANANWRFEAVASGALRLTLDGNKILDAPLVYAGQRFTGQAWMERGSYHQVKLEFMNNAPEASLSLAWGQNGSPTEPIPARYFYTGPGRRGEEPEGATLALKPEPVPPEPVPATGGDVLLQARVLPRSDRDVAWVVARSPEGEQRAAVLQDRGGEDDGDQPMAARLWLPPNETEDERRWQLTWFATDQYGQILKWNGAAVRILGKPKAKAKG